MSIDYRLGNVVIELLLKSVFQRQWVQLGKLISDVYYYLYLPCITKELGTYLTNCIVFTN